jgi:hypothetical protein
LPASSLGVAPPHLPERWPPAVDPRISISRVWAWRWGHTASRLGRDVKLPLSNKTYDPAVPTDKVTETRECPARKSLRSPVCGSGVGFGCLQILQPRQHFEGTTTNPPHARAQPQNLKPHSNFGSRQHLSRYLRLSKLTTRVDMRFEAYNQGLNSINLEMPLSRDLRYLPPDSREKRG